MPDVEDEVVPFAVGGVARPLFRGPADWQTVSLIRPETRADAAPGHDAGDGEGPEAAASSWRHRALVPYVGKTAIATAGGQPRPDGGPRLVRIGISGRAWPRAEGLEAARRILVSAYADPSRRPTGAFFNRSV